MHDPPSSRGPGCHTEAPQRSAAAKQANRLIIADRQRQARERVQAQERHRRICGELEQLASLVTYYGPRPLRPIPLGRFLVEGWWAA